MVAMNDWLREVNKNFRNEDRLFLYFLQHPEEEQYFEFNKFVFYDIPDEDEEPQVGINGDIHAVSCTGEALSHYCDWAVKEGYVLEEDIECWRESAQRMTGHPEIRG